MKRITLVAIMLLSLAGTSVAANLAPETAPLKGSSTSPAAAPEKAPAKAVRKSTPKRHVKATKRSKSATSAKTSSGGHRAAGPLTPGAHPLPVVESAPVYTGPPVDLQPVHPVRTPPLRNVRPIPPPKRGEDDDHHHPEPIHPVTPLPEGGPDLSPMQTAPGALISAPTPTGLGFDGIGVGLGTYTPSSNPPDVNGRIGATQYVQWNNTSFAVFDKTTGALLYGPASGQTLFQSLGGVCASHNDGDPVVSYDILAGRWVLSQFAVDGPAGSASHQCVAVSLTGDATGSYYVYDFLTDGTNFVDYPHMGVWPDGYYMSTHVFNAAGTSNVAARVYVFERQQMLLGQAARMQSKDLPKDGSGFQYGFLPADLDSVTPPPAGAQEYVIGPNAQFTNRTDISRVAVTWGVTPTMTLTSTTNTTVGVGNAPCISNTVAQQNRDCVPQPSPAVATDDLDNLGRHYMHRLAYRNNGGTESIMATGTTVGAATTPAHGAIKWMEWRGAAGSAAPTLFQSGTYDPTPTTSEYRWMPSIAMDKAGNIALGYSKSSPTVIPGIYMTGRLSGDTAGTMGAETTVQAGAGVQTAGAGNRWGDYSSMTIDPVDQCTFWYTNEYLKTNGAFNWSTRIASYKFPSCTPDTSWGTLTGTITSCATGVPLSGVLVNLSNGFAGTTDASGHYSISVPSGTYTATASDTDRACSTGSPATVDVVVPANGSSSQNFCMTGASNLQFNAIAIDDATNGNNNGVINKNECVNLNVTLKNNGCANESAISATLSTTTTGVTVTQTSSAYPDMAIDASGTNATPFKIQTSNTFVCGTAISLTLNVTYASGNKSVGMSLPTCAGGANQSIPTSSIALTDPGQPDRLGRDGSPSTCSGKACPGAINSAGTRNYRTFSFTNPASAAVCITVQINASCGANDVESAAYLNAYTPPIAQGDTVGNLCLGYLGDSGISGLGSVVPSSSYSFNVAASSTFVVVVSTATGGTTCGTFSGTVSGFYDLTAGPGACPGCTPPATPTASNTGPYCSGSTISLSTPTVAGATYAWTGPNGFTSSLQNPTRANATTADARTYSVTVTVAGCTSAAGTTSVVVNQTPATPTASNTGPYCSGGTISLSTPTVAGATYAWTGPNGFTSSLQNPTRSSITSADAGTYSVTVTTNSCTSAAGSTSVVVNPIPATPTASNTGPYCSGGTISLSTPVVAGATYSWTGPNGFTSALQNPTRSSATTADAGTYSVTVTVSGCTSAAGSTSVVVNPIPATPTATNGGPYCTGATIQLNTPTVAGATYSWTGPNGFTSALQNPTRSSAATADAGTYSLTITVSGCTSAAGSTSVIVSPIPATPTASNGGPYCAGATIQLNTPTVAGATYAWTGPNGFTSPLQNPTRSSATTADAGTYSVTITVNGCTSAAGTTNVVVNATPATPTISAGGATTFCTGGSVTLTSSSASGNQWYLNGNPIGGATSNTYNATASGNYTVVVTSGSCNSASAATTVTVNPIPATPTISAGSATTFCAGGSVTLTSSSASGNQWYLNGNPIGGATSNTYNATASGNYTVVVTTSGCNSVASAATTVTVNPIPATPTISAGSATTFCAGGSVTLTSSSATGNQWYVNGTPIPSATGTTYLASTAGDYTVIATANGCPSAPSATTTVTVNPIPSATITVASAMTSGASAAASVADAGVGATYLWTITGGTIDSGAGTRNINFTAGAVGTLTLNATVTRAGCSDAKSANVTVTAAAPAVTVTSISPDHGPFIGGTPVTVSGTGFQSGATLTIGGTAATSVVVVNATTITAKTPAHAPGTVDVTVTNPDISHATLAGGFVVVPQQFDANGDNVIDPADIFYLVNYLFTGGPAPAGAAGMLSGDANGDGVVDPADIFYVVNYLFTGGPQPMSAQPPRAKITSTTTSTSSISGSILLGTPRFRGGKAYIPVIVSSGGGIAPGALSLRLRIEGAAGKPAIHRMVAGTPAFEITRASAHELSYLVSFDGNGLLGPAQVATIAEIELTVDAIASLSLDPALTMLSDAGGMHKATAAAGTLHLGEINIDPRDPRGKTPRPDAQ
jgi:hypothetical protein